MFRKKIFNSTLVLGLLTAQCALLPMDKQINNNAQNGLGYTFSKLKNLASTSNQHKLVNGLLCLELMNTADELLTFQGKATKLTSIPASIQHAADKLNFKINTVNSFPGFNAAGLPTGRITVGEELLQTCTPQEVEYVMGHEIAHAQQYHIIKKVLLHSIVTVTPICLDKLVRLVEKKYQPNHSTVLYKAIAAYKKINTVLDNNPLLSYILRKSLIAGYSRYCEKEADMISAQKTGQIAAAITFFEKDIAREAQTPSTSWVQYLNPIILFKNLNNYFFSSHPSHETRIAYLKALQK